MTTIDKSGESLEKIIKDFRNEYKIHDWELQYEILKKPSKGIFGLFAHKLALVRFQLPSSLDRAKLFIQNLLEKMRIKYTSLESRMEGKTIYLDINGSPDSGFLIGKNGSMLDNLQYLLNRVFENDRQVERIYLDVDGYRERQADNFLKPYLSQIVNVKLSDKPVTLEPMNAAERRIIHRFVEKENGLRTLTIGEGERKRIVIFSAKQSEKEVLSKSKKYSQHRSKSTDPQTKNKSGKPKSTPGKGNPKPHIKQPQMSNPKHQ
ncbi:MAG TPA: Jag N-terminal domain-containing protein [Candidatus Cloacimonas sp.]|jgi:spoIIIJ-associated protein|nr:Jag N-terminal domain-containing protein [Candidatus Cloacimonas sp.]MDD2251179.1 Jag N-terminal domain-containing protein [Candidatus Cloacimonadota bacterium]MCK9158779.1 Jag N-terminal domain-containing protein [Candidatus Cloacimonas sp.]MCK9165532.1 Jag N-terminal domain-containing protein [Candidatus Cloacimonas sp.]MDD3734769.1 Jag N-terminal domain-containing protein [Candidatus Cloacimonadota bacterium]